MKTITREKYSEVYVTTLPISTLDGVDPREIDEKLDEFLRQGWHIIDWKISGFGACFLMAYPKKIYKEETNE